MRRDQSEEDNPLASLSIIVPCYNEQDVLKEAALQISNILNRLINTGLVDSDSAIYLVDDGSTDRTWPIIEDLHRANTRFHGIKLSRNCGHQNAVLAGLLYVPGDMLITIDADLQDDIDAMESMVRRHLEGYDLVLGVRVNRSTDPLFKRLTAEAYYRFLNLLGVKVLFNHADYRLMSRRAVDALREYEEVNLFLRGIITQLGFKTSIVEYKRNVRAAGETKYTLHKMLSLALNGITSFSTKPLRWITLLGFLISAFSFMIGAWAIGVRFFDGQSVPGWASTVVPMYMLGGAQILSVGIIGEYIGKIYLETKRRPRFHIERKI